MDRPGGCDQSHPALLTHGFSFLFFFFIFITSNDNKSHLCALWGPSGAHPAALELPLHPHTFTGVPNVLTEKILTVLASSSSQMNFALRLVRRSSSRGGGFTNTTYGMNSSEYTRFIFCRAEEEGGGRGGAMTFTEAKNRSAKNVANLDQSRFWEV